MTKVLSAKEIDKRIAKFQREQEKRFRIIQEREEKRFQKELQKEVSSLFQGITRRKRK